jgi:putative membrane protein
MKRRIVLAAGVLLLALTWLGPLPRLARHSFAAHMTMHMLVVAVAAPLVALAVSGRARAQWLAPVPMSIVELIVVWAWHAPALHHAARHQYAALALEQAMFFIAGLLVWVASLRKTGPGIVALLLTSMHMTLLGALLALSPRPLYAHAGLHALTPLDDQHLGGAIMLTAGGAAYLLGGLWLTANLLRTSMERK